MNLATTIKNFREKHASRATTYLLYFLIALIPFSVRHVFETSWNQRLGFYSDFTVISLYISDLVLGLLIVLALLKFKSFSVPKVWLYTALSLVAWLILELIIQNHETFSLQLYFSLRFMALLCLTAIVANVQVSREKISWFFSGLSIIQSVIGSYQYIFQKSIGLSLIGESPLGHYLPNIANIVSHGTKIIRSYGTFPHPNVLAGFLVIGILFNLYLLTKKHQLPRGIILYLALAINILAIFLTFSRGGLLGLSVALVLTMLFMLINKHFSELRRLIPPIILGFSISILVVFPHLDARATVSDNASKQRLVFNEIGDRMISANPITGLGLRTSLFHMKQYSSTPLEQWEIQPIHNYFLISWAELGFGAIAILILILFPISTLFKKKMGIWNIILLGVGSGILVLFLLDHYFYTIWQTQVLLWVYLGVCLQFHVKHQKTL